MYNGLLTTAAAIEDPFGDDIVDFPVAMFQAQLWKDFAYTEELMMDPIEAQNMVDRAVDEDLRASRGVKKHDTVAPDDDDTDEEEEDEEDEDGEGDDVGEI